MVLICTSLVISDVEHFFMHLVAIYMSKQSYFWFLLPSTPISLPPTTTCGTSSPPWSLPQRTAQFGLGHCLCASPTPAGWVTEQVPRSLAQKKVSESASFRAKSKEPLISFSSFHTLSHLSICATATPPGDPPVWRPPHTLAIGDVVFAVAGLSFARETFSVYCIAF